MSITYKESEPRWHVYPDGWDNRPVRPDRYDAKVGPFFVGAEDDGTGLWNWWVAFAEQEVFTPGGPNIYANGNALSWEVARREIEQALRTLSRDLLEALNAD